MEEIGRMAKTDQVSRPLIDKYVINNNGEPYQWSPGDTSQLMCVDPPYCLKSRDTNNGYYFNDVL